MRQARPWVAFAVLTLLGCVPAAREVKTAAEYGEEEETPPQPHLRQFPAQKQTLETVERPEEAQPEPPTVPPVERKLAELAHFYDALDALRAGTREDHVRIFWLGDSHTAADFMTHPVRQHLSMLGGDGGPGFVRLGMDGYRHGVVRFTKHGRWRKAPILPSQRTRVLDGVFGYGGIRTLPAAAAGASAEIRSNEGAPLEWTVSYRLLSGAAFEVRWGDEKWLVRRDEAQEAEGGIEAKTFAGSAAKRISVHHVAGDPQIFGAFGEYETPGVVLDTVGINGARAATALAWEPGQFVAQVAARQPELLVLAFGTNEVFDRTGVERYVGHHRKLVELARQAVPELPCWIVGAPDSATKEGNSKRRVFEVNQAQKDAADAMGCAFTSAFELMGGEGSFTRWAKARPAKARGDRIHLTILGYETLGKLLAQALVAGPALVDNATLADEAEPQDDPELARETTEPSAP